MSVAWIWPLFAIRAAIASVLPPAPAQRSTTCSPGFTRGQERRELRALVLDLEPALEELRLAVQRRPAPVLAERDAQADRRMRRPHRRKMREPVLHLLARRLERVRPDVEGRAGGKRLHFRHAVVAEGARERVVDPLGKIARDMRRRAVKRAGSEPAALLLA